MWLCPWKPSNAILSYPQEKLNALLWAIKTNIVAPCPHLTFLTSSSLLFYLLTPSRFPASLAIPMELVCSHFRASVFDISSGLNTLPYIICMVSLSLTGFDSKNTFPGKTSLGIPLKYPPPHPTAVHISLPCVVFLLNSCHYLTNVIVYFLLLFFYSCPSITSVMPGIFVLFVQICCSLAVRIVPDADEAFMKYLSNEWMINYDNVCQALRAVLDTDLHIVLDLDNGKKSRNNSFSLLSISRTPRLHILKSMLPKLECSWNLIC